MLRIYIYNEKYRHDVHFQHLEDNISIFTPLDEYARDKSATENNK